MFAVEYNHNILIMLRSNQSSKRAKIKSGSFSFATKAMQLIKPKQNKPVRKLSFSVDTLELTEDKKGTNRHTSLPRKSRFINSFTNTSTSSSNKSNMLNPYRKFLADFHILIKSFPDFPSVMMKTLVQREKGNMVAVSKFLQARGWKPIGNFLQILQNSENIHFTMSSFWGVDKPEYSSILEDKSPGSYFIVLCVPVYFVYYKSIDGIKKQRVPTPDLQSLPKSKTIHYTNPISRPIDISSNDLLVFT